MWESVTHYRRIIHIKKANANAPAPKPGMLGFVEPAELRGRWECGSMRMLPPTVWSNDVPFSSVPKIGVGVGVGVAVAVGA
jgi:hypothetical protein